MRIARQRTVTYGTGKDVFTNLPVYGQQITAFNHIGIIGWSVLTPSILFNKTTTRYDCPDLQILKFTKYAFGNRNYFIEPNQLHWFLIAIQSFKGINSLLSPGHTKVLPIINYKQGTSLHVSDEYTVFMRSLYCRVSHILQYRCGLISKLQRGVLLTSTLPYA